ncbi:MAG: WG repeat-containing protein [Bacteroidota bacterium]|nr:WG repeat-containing protein [Bacteroidota bacterium]
MLVKKLQKSFGLLILIQCLFVFIAKAQKSFVYFDNNYCAYGIKNVVNSFDYIDTSIITPPIYRRIENFNQFGLAVITRVAPLFSLFYDSNKQIPSFNQDSVYYWNTLYPDSILNNYRIVGCGLNKEVPFNYLICDKTKKPITSSLIFATIEQLLAGQYNNYVDQWGGLYPNVFNVSTEKVRNGSELIFLHEQYGLINEKGKVVLPLIYDYVGLKADEVLDKNQNPIYPIVYRNKLGFIDSTGKVIIEPRFVLNDLDYIYENFYNGICKIKQNNKFGMIDTLGKVIIPFIYESIYYGNGYNDHIAARDSLGNYIIFDLKGNLIEAK